MRSWPEKYAKEVLGTVLALRGQVTTEYECTERGQRTLRADMRFVPDPELASRGDLGIIDRIANLGQCIMELFSEAPRARLGFDCATKHNLWHQHLREQALRARVAVPPRPRLWMISPGRPRSLIADMAMKPMHGWPTGFWHVGGKFHVHLIVARDLPVVRDTLALRLLNNGHRLQRAMGDLDALPERSRLRRALVPLMVAWWEELLDTRSEDPMLYEETKARYAEWEQRVRGEGWKEGKREGRRAGIKEGERALLRKQLTLRFGKLPADAERRLKRASAAELERWAERVLSAENLAAMFAD